MPQYSMGLQLSPDKQLLTISINENQRQLLYVTATAAEVEQLIRQLAERRREMNPEVPKTLPEGQQITGEIDPIWALPSHPKAPDKVLMIRHFGMGWLSFLFPAASALKLANGLSGRGTEQTVFQPDESGPRH